MKILFSDQKLKTGGPSLFLAGPTPRDPAVRSWRRKALSVLETLNFSGTVFVPERHNWQTAFEYVDQVEWEYAALEQATVIVFWVPRDLTHLPGFTTNVEFGRYIGRQPCVYGRPPEAAKTRYLDWLYHKQCQQKPASTLEQTLQEAVHLVANLIGGSGHDDLKD